MFIPLDYEVKEGDTLSKIAKMFRSNVDYLAKINNIENVDKIKTGDNLSLYNFDDGPVPVPTKFYERPEKPKRERKKIQRNSGGLLSTDSSRMNYAEGELVGGQKELDKNNDGDITAEDFKMLREGKQEGGMAEEISPEVNEQMEMLMGKEEEEQAMLPDEMMEDNYLDFIIDEALSEEEESMLMSKLEQDEQLSMLFDKVIEVASEFSGAGPVEGPGTEVSDSIPARLSDGEFVFTAKAVEEIGADNLMSMMKEAEARADERLPAQEGGMVEEDEVQAPREPVQVQQDIRVTKETVGSQAGMQEEEDLVGDEIKKGMMSTRPYVRS